MNPGKLRIALNTIAVGLGELSEALTIDTPAAVGSPAGQGRESATASPSGSTALHYPPLEPWDAVDAHTGGAFRDEPRQQPSLADESVDFAPQGSLAQCPKHHQPYADGRYGPFCKSLTDDEAWGKKKPDGKIFCSITPKNAAEWLRQQAAVTA